MIALLASLFGLVSGLLPSVVKIFEQRSRYDYEIELTKIKIAAAQAGVEITSVVDEGVSLRQHDSATDGSGSMEALRASIRPVVTYFFFFLFIGVKVAAATFMFKDGYNAMDVLNSVWDSYTMAIFGAIMGFWFGTRAIGKMIEDTKLYSATVEAKRTEK